MAKVNMTEVVKKEGLRIVRLEVGAGSSVPEHSANAYVVIIPIKGEGTMFINKVPHTLSIAKVLEMEAGTPHSIEAKTDLEIMVVQAKLPPPGFFA